MKLIATEKPEQNVAAIDPWTVVHVAMGLASGLTRIPTEWALGAAVGYEIVEQYVERKRWGQELFETKKPESVPNAVMDVVAFGVGHWLGRRWHRTG